MKKATTKDGKTVRPSNHITKALRGIYAGYGIETVGDKIVTPIGPVAPVLKPGNTKTGGEVWTFSILPTKEKFNTVYGIICGTCPYNCPGCYATKGKYNCSNVITSMAANTILARDHIDLLERAIRAQLDNLPGRDIRIHAAGDFFSTEYAALWRRIVSDYAGKNRFWTYTKAEYENNFSGLDNGNIVKSLLPVGGNNYGTLEYIARKYIALVMAGYKPHICKCTFDPAQHCQGCKGCLDNLIVLFAEHSTSYKAKKDKLFPAFCRIVADQNGNNHKAIAARLAALVGAEKAA